MNLEEIERRRMSAISEIVALLQSKALTVEEMVLTLTPHLSTRAIEGIAALLKKENE